MCLLEKFQKSSVLGVDREGPQYTKLSDTVNNPFCLHLVLGLPLLNLRSVFSVRLNTSIFVSMANSEMLLNISWRQILTRVHRN